MSDGLPSPLDVGGSRWTSPILKGTFHSAVSTASDDADLPPWLGVFRTVSNNWIAKNGTRYTAAQRSPQIFFDAHCRCIFAVCLLDDSQRWRVGRLSGLWVWDGGDIGWGDWHRRLGKGVALGPQQVAAVGRQREGLPAVVVAHLCSNRNRRGRRWKPRRGRHQLVEWGGGRGMLGEGKL